jgi:hypothetical protein
VCLQVPEHKRYNIAYRYRRVIKRDKISIENRLDAIAEKLSLRLHKTIEKEAKRVATKVIGRKNQTLGIYNFIHNGIANRLFR